MQRLFILDNFNVDIRPPSKSHKRLTQALQDYNRTAHTLNESKENQKPIAGKIKRYCGLCEAELKPIKSKLVENLGISKPRFRCPVDKSVWEGWGLNLHFESRLSVKAIC